MGVKDKANKLFEEFWNWRLEESPEFATFIGIHAHNDKLQSYSLESFEYREVGITGFLQRTDALLELNPDKDTKRNLLLLKYDLRLYYNGLVINGYLFPITYLDGVHTEFERLITIMPQKTTQDYQNILSRYKAFPKQVSQIIEVMQKGIKLKMTLHKVSVEKVSDQLDVILVEPQESAFYKPFLSISENISKADRDDLKSIALQLVSECVLPSFKKLQDFVRNEYCENLRKSIAVTSLPDGETFYESCLSFHLGLNSYHYIHEAGLREVNRISQEMKKVISLISGHEMTPREFVEHIKGHEKFYFNTKEEMLESYKDVVFKKILPELQKVFKKMPKHELIIKSGPPSGIQAYYLAGPADGSHPGTFFVDSSNLKTSPRYEMMTLALHEGLPGHHLQASYMLEKENLPSFRREIEDRKYSEVPTHFSMHTSYVEGWGLYCEYLGYELGLYDDMHYRFGYMTFEMLRACRMVVDPGMHALGWSREKAIDFIMEHVPMNRWHIENEINRYITWPGQACAYKIGEMKIKHLRKLAEEELGDDFDLKEFHEVVLNSAGPLYFLEENVKEFIQKNKKE